MTLEWLIPLRTWAATMYFGIAVVAGYAFSFTGEQGVGWFVATVLMWAVWGAVFAAAWNWLDELIWEAEHEYS